MRRFILVSVGLVSLILLTKTCFSLPCSDKCWFLYHPSDSRSSYQDFVVPVPSDKKITGVITIDIDVLWDNIGNNIEDPRVTFRLMKTDREQPLVVAIDDRPQHDTQLVTWGEIDGINGELQFGEQHRISLFPNSNVRIQITDSNITSEHSYQIYVNGQHLSYNYLSAKKWGRFKNTRLSTTTKIKDICTDAFNFTRYNFISVCSDPKPVLCDREEMITINAVLGARYTLSCSGSGAPYLSSRWDRETYRPTFETHEEVIDSTTADNFIRSTLKINAFTLDHIGTWICTISNLNFQDTIQKTYQLQYSEQVSLMTRPLLETYDPSTGNTSLVWKIKGWPLDQIRLVCDIKTVRTHEIYNSLDTEQHHNTARRLAITLILTDAATQDLINCRLLNSDEQLDSTVLSKVGYSCRTGQYGEGKLCLNCPRGETSLPGSTKCFPANNSCPPDQYGVGNDCRTCPWGHVTFLNDMAAKEDDCRNISHLGQCPAGEYGYGSSRKCKVCPLAMTSLKGTVKFYDCVRVRQRGFCRKQGYWGEKDNCQRCPGNHTSDVDAVKIQDCYPVTSSCSGGYFGIDTNCTRCPNGMTSHPHTVVVEGCFIEQNLTNPDTIKKDEDIQMYRTFIYVIVVILFAVNAFVVIYPYMKRNENEMKQGGLRF